MNAKRVISLVLAAIMLMTVFAGCGNSGNNGDNDVDVTPTNAELLGEETALTWEELKAQIPEDAKGRTIEVYSWNNPEACKQAPAVIARFEEETGIKIKWTVGSDCENIAVAARVASNDSPDIVRIRSFMPSTVKVLQPLSEVPFNFNDTAWDKEMMAQYTYDGVAYATSLANSPYVGYDLVSYNKNLIESYGLEDPYTLWKQGEWTWDKMHEITEAFLDMAGKDYKGISVYNNTYAASMGLPTVDFDGEKYITNVGDPAYLEASKYMAKCYAQGLYTEQPLDTDGFNAGKLLFLVNSSMYMRSGHYFYKEILEKGHVGCVPIPAIAGQDTYYQIKAEDEIFGICKGAKNADIAPYFMWYYFNAENYFMESFYCDEKLTLEVVEWCMAQENVVRDYSASAMTADTVGFEHGFYVTDILKTAPDQMKSKLDSYLPMFEAMVIDYTNELYDLALE